MWVRKNKSKKFFLGYFKIDGSLLSKSGPYRRHGFTGSLLRHGFTGKSLIIRASRPMPEWPFLLPYFSSFFSFSQFRLQLSMNSAWSLLLAKTDSATPCLLVCTGVCVYTRYYVWGQFEYIHNRGGGIEIKFNYLRFPLSAGCFYWELISKFWKLFQGSKCVWKLNNECLFLYMNENLVLLINWCMKS